MGKQRYPDASELMITADGGGSKGSRVQLWKFELQRLADEINIPIYVSHLPPGTSKWNKIKHRLFSYISMNWRGQPLLSHEVIVSLIAGTTTKTGEAVYVPRKLLVRLTDYVRTNKIGLNERIFPISYVAAWSMVKKAGNMVDIELRPHDLRHAATYASRSGTPFEIVSKVILRHADDYGAEFIIFLHPALSL